MSMTFDEFMSKYRQRLDSYVSRFCKAFRLPGDLRDDLYQAAQIGVLLQIPSWRDYIGGKSAFNWCATAIRREMEQTVRRHHGLKIRSMDPIPRDSLEFEETMAVDRGYCTIDETLDLKRALTADRKPAHIVRFIATALSPASGADIARFHGISRQAVCMSVSQTRKRLRLAMG